MIWARNCPSDEDALLAFVSPSLCIADVQSFAVPGYDTIREHSNDRHIVDVLIHALSTTTQKLACLKVGDVLTPYAESSIAQLQSLCILDLSQAGSWRGVETFYSLGALSNLTHLSINISGLSLKDPSPLAADTPPRIQLDFDLEV